MDSVYFSYLKEKGIIWFNPSYGLLGFWDERRKLKQRLNKSDQEVWSHRDLKKAKEIYAISIIAKVMEKQEKTGPWWILKPKNDPPDGVIGTMVKDRMHVREVEVVEHIKGDLLATIRKKLSRKRYEPNTILVCYISEGGVSDDLEEKAKIISKEITSLDHIFLVFTGAKMSDLPLDSDDKDFMRALMKVSSVQIKPVYSFASIDLIDDPQAWREGREGSFLVLDGRGKGGLSPLILETPPKLF